MYITPLNLVLRIYDKDGHVISAPVSSGSLGFLSIGNNGVTNKVFKKIVQTKSSTEAVLTANNL